MNPVPQPENWRYLAVFYFQQLCGGNDPRHPIISQLALKPPNIVRLDLLLKTQLAGPLALQSPRIQAALEEGYPEAIRIYRSHEPPPSSIVERGGSAHQTRKIHQIGKHDQSGTHTQNDKRVERVQGQERQPQAPLFQLEEKLLNHCS